MSAHSLSCFFLLVTILNIPIYLFYLQANDSWEPSDTKEIFAKFSLGNLAADEFACDQ